MALLPTFAAAQTQATWTLDNFTSMRLNGDGLPIWGVVVDPSQTLNLTTLNGINVMQVTATPSPNCAEGAPAECGFYFNFFPHPYIAPKGFTHYYVESGPAWDPQANRLKFYMNCNGNVSGRSDMGPVMEIGTYVKNASDTDPNNQGDHYYHQFDMNLYANHWQLYEINRVPQHLVSDDASVNYPEDPTYSTDNVHYFDGLTRWYWDTINAANPYAGLTCSVANVQLAKVAGEPDTLVSSETAVYTGSKYELTWDTPKNENVTYNVYYSTQSMHTNGLSSGTLAGTAKSTGNTYMGALWDSPAMSEGANGMYFAIQPQGSSSFTELYLPNSSNINGSAPTAPAATERIQTLIDNPVSNVPYLGLVTFSGWSIDNVSAVTTTLLVDGAVVGTITNTIQRPDVCTAYSGQVDCPVVGWSFPFDTTALATADHTLEVRAVSTAGAHIAVSRTFTVANWSAIATNPIRIDIDRPSSSSGSFSGIANFSGWAIDDTATISGISIAIDGVTYGNAIYGGVRADVCAAFPNRQGCPNVGWNFSLDTNALADGSHTLALTASSSTGLHSVATTSFTVANVASQNPLQVVIDTPRAQSAPYSGTADFGGWALNSTASNTTVAQVRISVDGLFWAEALYGKARNDVCAVYPAGAGCPNVGWEYLLDTTQFANGTHMLEVTAVTASGQQTSVARGFTISNSQAANPTRLVIDIPGALTPILMGTTTVAGWSSNDNSLISNMSVYVDGNLQGAANYGNIQRPDVCAAFPNSQGCPNVGWNYVLDTTALTNGTHTLTLTAMAANGQMNIASATFTVANWTAAGNPFHITIDTPNASTALLSGYSELGGWAINSNAPVAFVSIAIDGSPIGSGNYGVARVDVCAVFPTTPGCPNVGWNFLLDTTMLADGNHTLDITAAAGGQNFTATASFKVANLGTPSGIQTIIDIPSSASSAFQSTAAFGGWAISANGAIGTVAVSVDGTLDGYAIYGGTGGLRNDVCAVFPNAAGCPEVGWNYEIDTTKYANGTHMLEVTATDAIGRRATQSASFVVNN